MPADSRATKRGGTLVVKRDGNAVTIRMEFVDQYDAMQVYDEAIDGAKCGELRVNLATGGRVHEH